MSVYGCVNGICQFAIFPRLVARFGMRRVFIACTASCGVLVAMFPLENLVLRRALEVQLWRYGLSLSCSFRH
jgi:MFS family permease